MALKLIAPPPLLVILGPTGSGKSDLAHRIALSRAGEIVSADAFAVYRGFDVGTAKPSRRLLAEVPYHLIDVADWREHYSAGRWAKDARAALAEIAKRGRLPIVCGGSGFYLEALLEGLPPGEATDPEMRGALARWAKERPDQAHRVLSVNDPVSARRIPPANLRYTVRALEILLATGARPSERARPGGGWLARWRVIKIGLKPAREDLYATIGQRVSRMLDAGWDEEVRRLLEEGARLDSNAFQAIGYRDVSDWVEGKIGRVEAQERIVTATRQLAKKQRTWFARERDVEWVSPAEAFEVALARLDKVEMEKQADGDE
jgi:tRNA dimethylallyltransferase